MYATFLNTFQSYLVFSLKDIQLRFPFFDTKNLINWQKKGYIIKLRNGYYLFTNQKIDEHALSLIANKLYSPSYVSLETALYHYGVIPEAVFCITSISTRKTKSFHTPLGLFQYASIKPSLFFGYKLLQGTYDPHLKIATLEKCILDFLYLRSEINDYYAFLALRWNKLALKNIDFVLLEEYSNQFHSPTLNKKISWLKHFVHA